ILRTIANRVLGRHANLTSNDTVPDVNPFTRADSDATRIRAAVAILQIQLLEYPAAGSVVWSSQGPIENVPVDVAYDKRAATLSSETDAQIAIVVQRDGSRDDVGADRKVDRPAVRAARPIHRILDCVGVVGDAIARRAEVPDIFDFRQPIWHRPS